ncbi:HTH-type transcriptional regulator CynR [Clostridium puniceum]|uniref:HTH-type transcriptional regulator CynR n=1 Tax=Clostridium puniceum TaxID=29367 RepID=A0A1S8T6Q7_9CLOT|nr:LysR family transcriptional regulator [Clostridium puniceum]OOM73467.1 HTH-type transcriptional regulator CynR [Clostridium puniceum]
MNNLQIEYFLSLANHKSFTATANALYVSQPAISKQIAALEKEIGFSLFFRSNRSVSLTPAGIIFFKTFTEFSNLYKQAIKNSQDIYDNQCKKLRLGCVDGMDLSNHLNKIFKSFCKQFPNVDYSIERNNPADLVKAIYNDELDAIITLESFFENSPDLTSSIFFHAQHLLYIHSSNHILSKECYDIHDFEDETFIVLSPSVIPTSTYNFSTWCKKNGLSPKKIKSVPNVESQMLSVEVGLGVTIADSLFRLYSNSQICNIELNTSHNSYIVWKKNTTNLLVPSFAKLASQINNSVLHKAQQQN